MQSLARHKNTGSERREHRWPANVSRGYGEDILKHDANDLTRLYDKQERWIAERPPDISSLALSVEIPSELRKESPPSHVAFVRRLDRQQRSSKEGSSVF